MNIKEGNKLIAEFMGWKFDNSVTFAVSPIDGHYTDDFPNHLAFHKSWDWLMPVVEKIPACVQIQNTRDCRIINKDQTFDRFFSGETNIEAVWIGCIKFIKWYNENCETRKPDPTKECKQEDKLRCTYPKCECMSMMRQ